MKLLSNKSYLELKQEVQKLQEQLKTYKQLEDCRIAFEKAIDSKELQSLSSLSFGILSSLINTMKSTKNILLLSQKKVRSADEIAYRDGAIMFADLIIKKLELSLIKQKNNEEII